MNTGKIPVRVWVSRGVFGGAVLRHSISAALSGAPADVATWDGASPPPDHAIAILVTGALPSDISDSLEARRHLAGLVPASRRVNVFIPTEPGLTLEEARASLGAALLLWTGDPKAILAADRAGGTVQSVAPRSRLALAIVQVGETVTELLRASAPRMNPGDAARAVSERVWAAVERGRSSNVESLIDEELASFLGASASVSTNDERDALRRQLRQELVGLGPIEPYFDDPMVSEIMVNGAGQIYVERGGRIERSAAVYASEDRLRLAISRIVGPAGRRVDASSPLCDVRLPDGSRANVVLPPVSVGGPVLTVRRFRPAFQKLEDLVSVGALTPDQREQLTAAVHERRNILIAGNSGAGKTTLLNALAALIPDDERIITMEDAAELRIQKPHVIRLETRPPNAEGSGEITMRDLVINALRMRPDRLVVGECRGPEAVPMLQAMNTGHDGSMTTLHANSATEALARLESMTLIGAPHWPADVVRRQIAAAIHLIVYVRRTGAIRRVESIVHLDEARA